MERSFVENLKKQLKHKPQFIQIILGPRQVGKTTGVMQLKKYFSSTEFFYFSADDQFSNHQFWMEQKWREAQTVDNAILIFDEIQVIPNWSRIIKSLWDKSKREDKLFHLVILGSSSLEIHQGLSESLAGRFQLAVVHHWSYEESKQINHNLTLEEYLDCGGYPATFNFNLLEDRKSYLYQSIIQPVITKDILQHQLIKKPSLFKQVFDLACYYGGQVISYNKILGQLQEGGNSDLIKNYLNYLEYAFLIKCLEKFSTSPLKVKTSSPKIIPLATGFMGLNLEINIGRKFEVYIGTILLKNFSEVYYWKDRSFEVDYVVRYKSKVFAIEVKYQENIKTHSGLKQFKSSFPNAETLIIDSKNYLIMIDLIKN